MSDSNSQATNYTDSRMVMGEGANFADKGSSLTNITQITALDGGAVAGAIGANRLALDASLGFAGSTVDGAFSFGSDALNFGSKTVASSLNFASDSLAESLAASAASARQATDAANNALAFAQASSAASALAQREAIDTAADSMSEALAYGGKQTATALDSLNGSAELVKNAYADAKGRGAMTDYLLMAAIGVAALVAYSAIRR